MRAERDPRAIREVDPDEGLRLVARRARHAAPEQDHGAAREARPKLRPGLARRAYREGVALASLAGKGVDEVDALEGGEEGGEVEARERGEAATAEAGERFAGQAPRGRLTDDDGTVNERLNVSR